jgi:hypothetical protein
MSDGGGYGGDDGGKKPVKERYTYLWDCCNCRTTAVARAEPTHACPICNHYRCSLCAVEKHTSCELEKYPSSRSLSKESRKSPEVATSDSGTSLATPVAVGVAAKDFQNANPTDIYGAERFLMSLRPKRRLLGRGSKGFTRDEIFSALSKAVEDKQPLPLVNALRQLAEATGPSGSTHTAVKKSGAIPTLEQIDSKMQINTEKAKTEEEEGIKITALAGAEQEERARHAYASANPRLHNPDGGSIDLQSYMLPEGWVDPALSQRSSPPISAKQTCTPGHSYVNSQTPPLPKAQDTSPPPTSQVRTKAISEAKSTLEEFGESEYDSFNSEVESDINIHEDTESGNEQSTRNPSPGRDLDPRNGSSAQDIWLQHQAQAQLHNDLFQTYSVLQAQENNLRLQLYNQSHSDFGLFDPLTTIGTPVERRSLGVDLPFPNELEALDQKKAARQKMRERKNTLRNAGRQRTLAQTIGSDIDDEDLWPVQFDANEAGSSGSKVRHETEDSREGSREIEEILGSLEKEEKARASASLASGSSPNAKSDVISEAAGDGTNLEDETLVPSTGSEHPAVTEPGDPEFMGAAASGRQKPKGKDRDPLDPLPEQSDRIAAELMTINGTPEIAQNTELSDRLAAIFRKDATIKSLTNYLKQRGEDLEGDGTVPTRKEINLLLEKALEAVRKTEETLPAGKRRSGTDPPESPPTDLEQQRAWYRDILRDSLKLAVKTTFVSQNKGGPSSEQQNTSGDPSNTPYLQEPPRTIFQSYNTVGMATPTRDPQIPSIGHPLDVMDAIPPTFFSQSSATSAPSVDEPIQGGEKQKDHELYGEKDPGLASLGTGYERGDGEHGPLRIEEDGEFEAMRHPKYRPKNRPSKGDAVLVSFMDGGKRPDVASEASREPLANDDSESHQESTQSFGEAIDAARDMIAPNRNKIPAVLGLDIGEKYSIYKEQATSLDATSNHVEGGIEKHGNRLISEELDPEVSSSYLGEEWRGGAYGSSDLEEDNKAVTHQQAAEPVRTTAKRGQEHEEHFRGGPGNQFFPCKYCPDLEGEFGFWQFDHLKLHMKTKHNREMESESQSPISKKKISIDGRKYEKDDQQAGAADRAFDGPENEARMVPSEIDVEDQATPLLGRQGQPTPPASHTPPLLQITESSSSQMKVITSSGGHHLGSSRTDPWRSADFVEEEEDEGWDRDEDNRDGSIRGEDVQENIYTTSAPVFAPETISYEDCAIETKSSTARESLSKHYRATTSRDSKSPTDWAKLKEPFGWKLDDEDRHETDRGSDSISSHSQNFNTIELEELAEVAKMAKVYSTPGVLTEPADQKVGFEGSIAAMRAEIERRKAEDAQAAADNALLTAEAARDVFRRHDERLPKADSFLEAVVEEDVVPNQKRMFNVAPHTTSPRNADYIVDTTPSLASKFHPSKYEWSREEHLPEKPFVFQTSTFKNSHYNTAHYKNPNLQPDEWNSNHHFFEKSEHNSDGPILDNTMRSGQLDEKDLGSEEKTELVEEMPYEIVKEMLSNTVQASGCSSKSLSSHLGRIIRGKANLTFDSLSKTPCQMWERAANL